MRDQGFDYESPDHPLVDLPIHNTDPDESMLDRTDIAMLDDMTELSAFNQPAETDVILVDDGLSSSEDMSTGVQIEVYRRKAMQTHDLATLVMNYGATLSDPYFSTPIPMTDRSRYLVEYRISPPQTHQEVRV